MIKDVGNISNRSKYSIIMSVTLIICFIVDVLVAHLIGFWATEDVLFYLFVVITVLTTIVINICGAVLGAIDILRKDSNRIISILGFGLNSLSLFTIITSFRNSEYISLIFQVSDMLK